MKKLVVEDVKVGVSEGGMACGPVPGSVIAEACIRDLEEGTEKFYSLSEVDGIPNFCITDESTYDRQIEEVDDEEFWDMLSAHCVEGIGDYQDIFDNQEEMERQDPEHLLIWKYLIFLVRADEDEVEKLKAASVGKCLGDFEIPISDVEQDYLDDMVDEESEDDEAETLEDLIDGLSDAFSGLVIDTRNMDLEEGESPEGSYSSEVFFKEGQNEYKLKYSFEVNSEAEILYVSVPDVEKLVGNEYIPCPEGEVSAEKICEVLNGEMNSWL